MRKKIKTENEEEIKTENDELDNDSHEPSENESSEADGNHSDDSGDESENSKKDENENNKKDHYIKPPIVAPKINPIMRINFPPPLGMLKTQQSISNFDNSIKSTDKLRRSLTLVNFVKDAEPDDKLKRKAKLDYFDRICSEIISGLYLSSCRVAKNKRMLQHNGITHIINCAGNRYPNLFLDTFEYLTLNLLDKNDEEIASLFFYVLEYIDNVVKKNGKVLIHCHQGVSRSATFVIAYLMWQRDLAYDDASNIVRSKRGVCRPNVGFMSSLMEWRKRWKDNKTKLYRIAPHVGISRQLALVPKLEHVKVDNLDPRSCFILQSTNQLYVWIGNNSIPFASECVFRTVLSLQHIESAPKQVTAVQQGLETREFWTLLNYTNENEVPVISTRDKFNHEYDNQDDPAAHLDPTEANEDNFNYEAVVAFRYPELELIEIESAACIRKFHSDSIYVVVPKRFNNLKIWVGNAYIASNMQSHFSEVVALIKDIIGSQTNLSMDIINQRDTNEDDFFALIN